MAEERKPAAPRTSALPQPGKSERQACYDNQDLRGIDFSGTDFSEASFRGANLDGANLNRCKFFAADLSGASLNDASLVHCDFLDSTATKITAHRACLQNASLMSANFTGADLFEADLKYAFLGGTNLMNANLTNTELTHTAFLHTCLADAQIGGTFNGTTLCDVDLSLVLGLTRAFHASPSYVDFRTVEQSLAGLERLSADNARSLLKFFAECGVPEQLLTALAKGGHAPEQRPSRSILSTEIDPHDARLDPLDRYRANDGGHLPLARRNLAQLLEENPSEQQLQNLLEKFPELLVHRLGGGGHGRWVIPQLRFGGDHISDFVAGAKDSLGHHWHLIELEGCDKPLFNQNGDPAQMLNHGIRQIQDWRIWLEQNLDVARRERADRGLGLRDIEPDTNGLVLIGRRSTINEHTRLLRRRMTRDLRIQIHTYDWLLEE